MIDVDDLIAFVRRCLDEDELVARAASVGPWRASRSEKSVYAAETSVVNMPGPLPDWATYVVPPDSEGSEGIEPADARHIARWDPARVLAEVQAKRRILDLHHETELESEPDHEPLGAGCAECAHFDWPCDTIRLQAQPYAGQDGWREEWRA